MDAIRIITPKPAKGQGSAIANGTRVELADGTEIPCVTSINISMLAGDIVRAEVEVFVGGVDVMAHTLLGLRSLQDAAAAHGYRLVQIAEE